MEQRLRLYKEVDEELRRFVEGNSHFADQIELALSKVDLLTRELIFFRAEGGDYRQAVQKFHISESTFHRRVRNFRSILMLTIAEKPL